MAKVDAKSVLKFTAAVVVIFGIAYYGFILISGATSVFSGATDPIKAASITAVVTVTIFVLGRYFEQAREQRSKVNLEKIVVYKRFFDFYFDMFSHNKIHGKEKEKSDILKEMLEFQKDVVFWGSDSVLKAYLDYKDTMLAFSNDGRQADKEVLAKNLSVTIRSVAVLLVAMRKDIGYASTKFSAKDLGRLQLASDPETQKILQYL